MEGAFREPRLARSLRSLEVDSSGGVATRPVYIPRVAGMTADMRHSFAGVARGIVANRKKREIEKNGFSGERGGKRREEKKKILPPFRSVDHRVKYSDVFTVRDICFVFVPVL